MKNGEVNDVFNVTSDSTRNRYFGVFIDGGCYNRPEVRMVGLLDGPDDVTVVDCGHLNGTVVEDGVFSFKKNYISVAKGDVFRKNYLLCDGVVLVLERMKNIYVFNIALLIED